MYLLDTKQRVKFDFFCNRFGIEYMTKSSLDIASEIYADLKHKGQMIDEGDILIASLAMEHCAMLATNNLQHFSRISKLRTETWI